MPCGSHDDRPGYQQMLEDARSGKFEVLVAEDLDRLNRRLEHTANLYSRLQFVGERKINEAQAAVVREIFRRFAAGDGPRAIARALNERGVPGPYGRPWEIRRSEGTPRRAQVSSITSFITAGRCGAGSASSRIRQRAAASLD